MRKLILAMQVTLDGFVAGPNDEMDWIVNTKDEWQEMLNDLERTADTFLLGAKMYPGYSDYWRGVLKDPKADPQEKAFAELADRTPHIVFSRTMTSVDWANTRIARDAEKEINKLKKEPGKDLFLWGGASFASEMLSKGLVDELRLTMVPTLLGKGKPLFGGDQPKKLSLIESRKLSEGVLVNRYKPER